MLVDGRDPSDNDPIFDEYWIILRDPNINAIGRWYASYGHIPEFQTITFEFYDSHSNYIKLNSNILLSNFLTYVVERSDRLIC